MPRPSSEGDLNVWYDNLANFPDLPEKRKSKAAFFYYKTGEIENRQLLASQEEIQALAQAIYNVNDFLDPSAESLEIGFSSHELKSKGLKGIEKELHRIQKEDLAAFNAFPWDDYSKELEHGAENLSALLRTPIRAKCYHVDRVTYLALSIRKGIPWKEIMPSPGVSYHATRDNFLTHAQGLWGREYQEKLDSKKILFRQTHELIHTHLFHHRKIAEKAPQPLVTRVSIDKGIGRVRNGFFQSNYDYGTQQGHAFNEGAIENLALVATKLPASYATEGAYTYYRQAVAKIFYYIAAFEKLSPYEMWSEVATMMQQGRGRDLLQKRLEPYFGKATEGIIENLNLTKISARLTIHHMAYLKEKTMKELKAGHGHIPTSQNSRPDRKLPRSK